MAWLATSRFWGIGLTILLGIFGVALLLGMRGAFGRGITAIFALALLTVILHALAGAEAEVIARIRAGGMSGLLCCLW